MCNSAWFRFSLLNSQELQSFTFAVKRNMQKTEVHKWSGHAVLHQIKPLDYTMIPETHLSLAWTNICMCICEMFDCKKCFWWSASHIIFHSFSLNELTHCRSSDTHWFNFLFFQTDTWKKQRMEILWMCNWL